MATLLSQMSMYLRFVAMVLLTIAITSSAADQPNLDAVIPEAYTDALTPIQRISKIWGQLSVRSAAEVSLMEMETTAATSAEATKVVAYKEAAAAVKLMQTSGDSDNACADLAQTTIDSVRSNVKTSQDLLDTLDIGENCDKQREDAQAEKEKAETAAAEAAAKIKAVDDAQKAVDEAQKKADDAKEATTNRKNLGVDYGDHYFHDLNQCNSDKTFCWNDAMVQTYQKVKAEVGALEAKERQAEEELEAAKKVLEEAQRKASADPSTANQMEAIQSTRTNLLAAKTQLGLVMEGISVRQAQDRACECKARALYEKEWKLVSTGPAVQSRKVAYTRAKHMLCVINHVSMDACSVTDMPQVKPRTLPAYVQDAVCNSTDTGKFVSSMVTSL